MVLMYFRDLFRLIACTRNIIILLKNAYTYLTNSWTPMLEMYSIKKMILCS
jgi:ABC-type long-subunit fatty acid transport system fused permease/ATPase subunit